MGCGVVACAVVAGVGGEPELGLDDGAVDALDLPLRLGVGVDLHRTPAPVTVRRAVPHKGRRRPVESLGAVAVPGQLGTEGLCVCGEEVVAELEGAAEREEQALVATLLQVIQPCSVALTAPQRPTSELLGGDEFLLLAGTGLERERRCVVGIHVPLLPDTVDPRELVIAVEPSGLIRLTQARPGEVRQRQVRLAGGPQQAHRLECVVVILIAHGGRQLYVGWWHKLLSSIAPRGG
mmetsp:Transcript_10481/g.25374  ORF Transcript_10481/g.25374 Transcript_10481/m.25374 type:complete len:236 (-) Transcript_10481:300-1007(-)